MLGALQAEQQLLAIEAATTPHLKQDALQRVVDRYQRRARCERPESVTEQLMKAMRVVYEPAKEVGDVG